MYRRKALLLDERGSKNEQRKPNDTVVISHSLQSNPVGPNAILPGHEHCFASRVVLTRPSLLSLNPSSMTIYIDCQHDRIKIHPAFVRKFLDLGFLRQENPPKHRWHYSMDYLMRIGITYFFLLYVSGV